MLKFLIESTNYDNKFNFNAHGESSNYISGEKLGNVLLRDYYRIEKRKYGILSHMTADEYIQKCIKDIFHSNYDRTVTHVVNFDTVSEYAEAMRKGDKFPVPYLDYTTHNQEGRHRAFAFAQAFGKYEEMPVVEIYKTTPNNTSLDEIYDYCNKKDKNHARMWFIQFASNIGYSEKDIYEYLGEDVPIADKDDYDDTEPEYEFTSDNLDNIDDLLMDLSADELGLDLSDEEDIEETIKKLSEKSGMSISEISDLDAYDFMRLCQKYLY